MKPHKISFYIYAEDDQEAIALKNALNNFVRSQYDQGILVKAGRLTELLGRYGKNPIVANFLK